MLSIGVWAQHDTIFSFQFDSVITLNTQTAVGGTVYVGNPKGVSASDKVSCGFALKLDGDPSDSNTKYLRVDLQSGSSLQDGDTVVVSGYIGSNPSEAQSFVISADRAAETRYARLQPTAKNVEQSLSFVVKDAATGLGATSFYISRNTASLYLSVVSVFKYVAPSTPVSTVTIGGETECFLGESITLSVSTDVEADTIWWTDKYGTKQVSKDGVFEFTPDAAGEYEFTAWAENEYNESPVSKMQTITVKPALCAKLYPAASGDDLSVGSVVDLTSASVGGSIEVIGMKTDKSSIKYNAAGLQLGGGGADSILVILDHFLIEGTIIELTMQSTKNGTRGLNILANNTKVYEATWAASEANEVKTISYTVGTGNALIGLNKFGLQRNESIYLKSVKVANCGDEVPSSIDNTEVKATAVKMVENGQLFIIQNGVKYNAQGQIVR